MKKSFEEIHAEGVKRHAGRWYLTNRRIVDACIFADMDPTDYKMKRMLSAAALRVLDGDRLDRGQLWNQAKQEWREAEEPKNA